MKECLGAFGNEYLREDVPPISVVSLKPEELNISLNRVRIHQVLQTGVFVDYFGNPDYFSRGEVKGVNERYAISLVDEKDKWSNRYDLCTKVIVVGRDKVSGREISFLTHQNYDALRYNKHNFREDLNRAVDEILLRSEDGTVDVSIAGGICLDYSHPNWIADIYQLSIEELSLLLSKKLNFEPKVIGPNSVPGSVTDFYFSTKNRLLFLVRPEQKSVYNDLPYFSSQLKERMEFFRGEVDKEIRLVA